MSTPSHVLMMALFSCCVAIVGGALLKDTLREQAKAAGRIFGSLMAGAIILGWILYIFPL
jgi:hypothetical protein